MASPHVAGAAALLVPQLGRDPARIQRALQQSTADLGPRGTDPTKARAGSMSQARSGW
jgi:hypothetical protein